MNTVGAQKSRLWVALPTAILVGVIIIFLFFLFMVLYGHVINPGHEEGYYQDFANRVGPYANIIGGIPVMFAAGWGLRRFLGPRALKVGILTWAIYVGLYLTILIAVGELMKVWHYFIISAITKLTAIYLGARTGRTELKES